MVQQLNLLSDFVIIIVLFLKQNKNEEEEEVERSGKKKLQIFIASMLQQQL